MAAVIAIVGRPNVGKSALFNRIVGRRIAIVHDEPGVTRDRISAEAEWNGRAFTLIDTGGLGLVRGEKAADVITRATYDQVQLAIESASVILFVVNVQEGVVPLDREVAERLRRSGKPVLVTVNKADNSRAAAGADEFTALGFDKVFPVSAIHCEGIDPLMTAAIALIQQEATAENAGPESATRGSGARPSSGAATSEQAGVSEVSQVLLPSHLAAPEDGRTPAPLKIAIVGRPNVGKSSIINALTQSERVIVSAIPGTTRDAVDVPFEIENEGVRHSYVLIDTAGVRKPKQVGSSVEFFSVKRTEDSITRCDIAVLVLDAEAGITEQDKKVADKIVEARKACIVIVNKWDLMEKEVRQAREEEIDRRHRKKKSERGQERLTTLGEFGEWVQERLFFLDYAPVIFTSALSGFNLDRLLEAVRYVAAQLQQKIPTGILNRTLLDAVERRQPISAAGHRLKFFYATQVRQAPPTFLLFVNRDELFGEAYKKHLTGQLRRAFGFEGCPIILVPKARPKTIEPVRKKRGSGGRRGAPEQIRSPKFEIRKKSEGRNPKRA